MKPTQFVMVLNLVPNRPVLNVVYRVESWGGGYVAGGGGKLISGQFS